MAMSSEFLTFKNKMRHFDDDIEFIDILNSTVKENSISPDADKLFESQMPRNTQMFLNIQYVKIIDFSLYDISNQQFTPHTSKICMRK